METLEFKTTINASALKVWDALWIPENYNKWTSVFSSDSHAIGEWKQGNEISFVDGSKSGLRSTITTLNKPKEMTFLHQGELKNAELAEKSEWKGAVESYIISENSKGECILITRMDVSEEFAGFFNETFLKGIEIVKEIAENS